MMDMTKARAVLVAVPRANPRAAENPTFVPWEIEPRTESSPMAAPRKQPSNAPMTLPMMGSGMDRKSIPAKPPISAPHAALPEPPARRVIIADIRNSRSSAKSARPQTHSTGETPIQSQPDSHPISAAPPTISQIPGSRTAVRTTPVTQPRQTSITNPTLLIRRL